MSLEVIDHVGVVVFHSGPAICSADVDRTGLWGDAIKYWLYKRDWSQAELARRAKVSEKRIGHAAKGGHVNTRTLELIATAIGIDLIDLLVSPERSRDERLRTALEVSDSFRRVADQPESRAEIPAREGFQERATDKEKTGKSVRAKTRR